MKSSRFDKKKKKKHHDRPISRRELFARRPGLVTVTSFDAFAWTLFHTERLLVFARNRHPSVTPRPRARPSDSVRGVRKYAMTRPTCQRPDRFGFAYRHKGSGRPSGRTGRIYKTLYRTALARQLADSLHNYSASSAPRPVEQCIVIITTQ